MISYAQNFEDVMLCRALKHVEKGFYIDVGAAWPDMHSVTKAFYLMGWRGINIEPNPELYSQLIAKRPEDINVQFAVSDQKGKVEFNLFPETGLSTLDSKIAHEHIKENYRCQQISVSVSSLSDIWESYVPKNQEVHFLKVDVEGLERAVLKGNNWSVNRPWIVLVESTLPLSQVATHQDWESILTEASYSFAYADGLNRFYVDKCRPALLAAFKYPPNVFDEFVLVTEVEALEGRRQAEIRATNAETLQRQAEIRAANAEAAQRQAEVRTVNAEAAQRQAESRAVSAQAGQQQAENRAASAETAQQQAEIIVAQLQMELMAMIHSNSWRITRPLRHAVVHMRWLRGKTSYLFREVFIDHSKALLVRLLHRAKTLVGKSQLLKRVSLQLLSRFPGTQSRISILLGASATAAFVEPFEVEPIDAERLEKLEKIVACTLDEITKERNA